ncbi:hypothetical protein LguiA_030980 [Lonicera macranthoides]
MYQHQVSRMGFGCAGLSGVYDAPLPHEAGCLILKEAFDKGITFFDTSDSYGRNDNAIMIGKALKQFPREKGSIATKFGVNISKEGKFSVKGTPEYVRKCCEASLKRLDVGYIDLYYQHHVDVSVPIEDTMGELKKLVNEGKIKYIGLSEANIYTIRRAHAIHSITAVQMEYFLWTREIEADTIPLCRRIVAYSPLGHGFFGGKAISESLSAVTPRFNKENLEKNKLLYAHVTKLAEKHDCMPSQLALAWLIHQGDDIVPIPGTTKVKNLENNIGSLGLKLTEEDLNEISKAVSIDEVAGEREGDSFSKYSWKNRFSRPIFVDRVFDKFQKQRPSVRHGFPRFAGGDRRELDRSSAASPLTHVTNRAGFHQTVPSSYVPRQCTSMLQVRCMAEAGDDRICCCDGSRGIDRPGCVCSSIQAGCHGSWGLARFAWLGLVALAFTEGNTAEILRMSQEAKYCEYIDSSLFPSAQSLGAQSCSPKREEKRLYVKDLVGYVPETRVSPVSSPAGDWLSGAKSLRVCHSDGGFDLNVLFPLWRSLVEVDLTLKL